jgi:hypothetical protein
MASHSATADRRAVGLQLEGDTSRRPFVGSAEILDFGPDLGLSRGWLSARGRRSVE